MDWKECSACVVVVVVVVITVSVIVVIVVVVNIIAQVWVTVNQKPMNNQILELEFIPYYK